MGFEWGGLIIGAIIGAIVGGFTAAITGGDVSKGMLYGAAAGAILYGVNWAISAYSTTTTGGSGVVSQTATVSAKNPSGVAATRTTTQSTVKVGGSAGADKALSNWESFKSFASSDAGGMIGEAAIMMGGQMVAGSAQAKAAEKNAKAQREHDAEQARWDRGLQAELLDKRIDAEKDTTALELELAHDRRKFDISQSQTVREYEELRAERLDSISNARGALEGAVVSRKNTARPDSPSVLQQIKEDRAINPATTPVADNEGNIAYV